MPDEIDSGEERQIAFHMPLIRAVCAGFIGRGLTYDELLQAGRIGLLKALRSYRPERGAGFPTYATKCVQWACLDAIQEATALITIPPARKGEERKRFIYLSLDAEENGEGIAAEVEKARRRRPLRKERDYELVRFLAYQLPGQERDVIVQHYFQEVRLSQLARMWGISRQRVSTIHRRGLDRLKVWYDEGGGANGGSNRKSRAP